MVNPSQVANSVLVNNILTFVNAAAALSQATRVNGEWLCQRERAIFEPHRIDTSQQITINLSLVITSATFKAMPN